MVHLDGEVIHYAATYGTEKTGKPVPIIWDHVGRDMTLHKSADEMRPLLAAHANLYLSVKQGTLAESSPENPIDHSQNELTTGEDKDTVIKDEWLQLIKDYPERFLIGSDQEFYPEGYTLADIQAEKFTDTWDIVYPLDATVEYHNAYLFKLVYGNAYSIYPGLWSDNDTDNDAEATASTVAWIDTHVHPMGGVDSGSASCTTAECLADTIARMDENGVTQAVFLAPPSPSSLEDTDNEVLTSVTVDTARFIYGGGGVSAVNADNCPLDENGTLRAEWWEFITAYPDRFVMGSDTFVLEEHDEDEFALQQQLLQQLPKDVAKKVGSENAKAIVTTQVIFSDRI